jgi:hypothetical protein
MADLSVTAASVKPGAGAQIKQGTSGGAVVAGDAVAKDSSGNIVQADANGAAPTNVLVGIALNSTPGAGQPIAYTDDAPLLEGFTATTAGTPYVLSGTVAKVCPVADLASGMTGNLVGFGQASNKLQVKVVNSGAAVP